MHSNNVVRRIGHRMKIFLSHSTKDKQFVQTLAHELEAEGIEPWLCEVDVEVGNNFVAEIEKGLREADLTGAVLVARCSGLEVDAPGMEFGNRARDLRIADASWC